MGANLETLYPGLQTYGVANPTVDNVDGVSWGPMPFLVPVDITDENTHVLYVSRCRLYNTGFPTMNFTAALPGRTVASALEHINEQFHDSEPESTQTILILIGLGFHSAEDCDLTSYPYLAGHNIILRQFNEFTGSSFAGVSPLAQGRGLNNYNTLAGFMTLGVVETFLLVGDEDEYINAQGCNFSMHGINVIGRSSLDRPAVRLGLLPQATEEGVYLPTESDPFVMNLDGGTFWVPANAPILAGSELIDYFNQSHVDAPAPTTLRAWAVAIVGCGTNITESKTSLADCLFLTGSDTTPCDKSTVHPRACAIQYVPISPTTFESFSFDAEDAPGHIIRNCAFSGVSNIVHESGMFSQRTARSWFTDIPYYCVRGNNMLRVGMDNCTAENVRGLFFSAPEYGTGARARNLSIKYNIVDKVTSWSEFFEDAGENATAYSNVLAADSTDNWADGDAIYVDSEHSIIEHNKFDNVQEAAIHVGNRVQNGLSIGDYVDRFTRSWSTAAAGFMIGTVRRSVSTNMPTGALSAVSPQTSFGAYDILHVRTPDEITASEHQISMIQTNATACLPLRQTVSSVVKVVGCQVCVGFRGLDLSTLPVGGTIRVIVSSKRRTDTGGNADTFTPTTTVSYGEGSSFLKPNLDAYGYAVHFIITCTASATFQFQAKVHDGTTLSSVDSALATLGLDQLNGPIGVAFAIHQVNTDDPILLKAWHCNPRGTFVNSDNEFFSLGGLDDDGASHGWSVLFNAPTGTLVSQWATANYSSDPTYYSACNPTIVVARTGAGAVSEPTFSSMPGTDLDDDHILPSIFFSNFGICTTTFPNVTALYGSDDGVDTGSTGQAAIRGPQCALVNGNPIGGVVTFAESDEIDMSDVISTYGASDGTSGFFHPARNYGSGVNIIPEHMLSLGWYTPHMRHYDAHQSATVFSVNLDGNAFGNTLTRYGDMVGMRFGRLFGTSISTGDSAAFGRGIASRVVSDGSAPIVYYNDVELADLEFREALVATNFPVGDLTVSQEWTVPEQAAMWTSTVAHLSTDEVKYVEDAVFAALGVPKSTEVGDAGWLGRMVQTVTVLPISFETDCISTSMSDVSVDITYTIRGLPVFVGNTHLSASKKRLTGRLRAAYANRWLVVDSMIRRPIPAYRWNATIDYVDRDNKEDVTLHLTGLAPRIFIVLVSPPAINYQCSRSTVVRTDMVVIGDRFAFIPGTDSLDLVDLQTDPMYTPLGDPIVEPGDELGDEPTSP